MAKVMVSIPDELLSDIDAEAKRRRTTRSGFLQEAARGEIGLLRRDRQEILDELDTLGDAWSGPVGASELVRADRDRDG